MEDIRKYIPVRDFLLETSIYDDLEAVAKKQNISQDRVDEFLQLTDAVVKGNLSLQQMPSMLSQAFGLNDKQSNALAADISGYVLLPLENYLPNVRDQIITWGGSIEQYPKLRVEKEKTSPDKLIQDFAKRMGLTLSDDLMARFVYLTKGYLTKSRAREATKNILMRSIRIGGLDFTDEMAENFFARMDAEAKNFQFETTEVVHPEVKKPYAPAKPEVQNDSVAAPVPEQTRPGKPDSVKVLTKPGPRIQKKILSKAEILEKVKGMSIKNVKKAIRGTMERALNDRTAPANIKKLLPPKPKQPKKGLASWSDAKNFTPLKALKDVRPKIIAKRTPIALEPPLRLPARDAATHELANSVPVVSGLELSLQEKEELKKHEKEMKRNQKADRANESAPRTGDLRSKDREVLDRRHAVMTGVVSDEKIESVLPNARVSAARSKEEELMLQKGTVSEEMIRKAQTASRPAMAKASVTAKSVLPAQGTSGRVTDIKAVRRLIGPIEELGTMGVKEFRRLSSDAKEATRKIGDKLDLLQATSYEERIKGVKAWRGSPINRLYLEMSKEALRSGKSIAEIGAERRNNGKESLSPAEIQAIVVMNGQIKF